MLSQPRVQITLCRSFLYQAHPSAWASLLLGTHAGGPAAGISKAGQRARARRSSPRCPSGGMPVHPAQRSPGSGWDPNASWACTSTNLALALATRGAEEQKTRRSLPSRKRQPMTPQKKTAFPSVSLQTNGRRGARLLLQSWVPQRDHRYPGQESSVQTAASYRQTQQSLVCSLALG